jgi:MFS family permease
MWKTKPFTNLYFVAPIITIGGLLQGFDVSSMSAIIGTQVYKDYFNNPSATHQGAITASMAGGSLTGALFSSWTGDRIGRRDSLFVACLIWIVGSSLMAAVQNVGMLVAARVINGFSVGMLTSQGYAILTFICSC